MSRPPPVRFSKLRADTSRSKLRADPLREGPPLPQNLREILFEHELATLPMPSRFPRTSRVACLDVDLDPENHDQLLEHVGRYNVRLFEVFPPANYIWWLADIPRPRDTRFFLIRALVHHRNLDEGTDYVAAKNCLVKVYLTMFYYFRRIRSFSDCTRAVEKVLRYDCQTGRYALRSDSDLN